MSGCLDSGEPGSGGGDHKGLGAVVAFDGRWQPAVPLIEGHHGGLHNMENTRAWVQERSSSSELRTTLEELPGELRRLVELPSPPTDPPASDRIELELL